jgi:Ca2+-binding RTX toxin-like protein
MPFPAGAMGAPREGENAMGQTQVVSLFFDTAGAEMPAREGGTWLIVKLDQPLAAGETLLVDFGTAGLGIPAGKPDGTYTHPFNPGEYVISEGGTRIAKFVHDETMAGSDVLAARIEVAVPEPVPFLEVGEHIPVADFDFFDAHGRETSLLHASSTRLAVLDIGAMWCLPSQYLAAVDGDIRAALGSDFEYKTLLVEDFDRNTSDTADAARWAAGYGLDQAAVYSFGGDGGAAFSFMERGLVEGFPTLAVVDQVTGEVLGRFNTAEFGDDLAALPALMAQAINGVMEHVATLAASEGVTRIGGEAGDALAGSVRADLLDGRAGDDFIDGSYGNDRLRGGAGHDAILGGAGIDRILGGHGDDRLSGNEGDDILSGEAEHDTLYGYAGGDRLFGGDGVDELWGDEGDDVLRGGAGFDTLIGGEGHDLIDGGEEFDTVRFLDAADITATLDASGSGIVRIGGVATDKLLNVEALIGGDGNDRLTGNAGANRLAGGGGDDVLVGGGGPYSLYIFEFDDLYGGDGDDLFIVARGTAIMDGGAGTNRYRIGAEVDGLVLGLSGYDIVDLSLLEAGVTMRTDGELRIVAGDFATRLRAVEEIVGTEFADRLVAAAWHPDLPEQLIGVLDGAGGDDVLRGRAHDAELRGGEGDDLLIGEGGNDRLTGGAGLDRLRGGEGDDFYEVTDAGDRVFEAAGEGWDNVIATVSQRLGANVEQLNLIGTDAIDGFGNELDNVIYGNDGANLLSGGDGADLLVGAGGADRMRGGAGDDTFYVDSGGDRAVEALDGGYDVVVSDVSYRLGAHLEQLELQGEGAKEGRGNALDNALFGSAGDDRLFGEAGEDWLDGGAGDDALHGGAGRDWLTGGAGADLFCFDTAPGSDDRDAILDFAGGEDRIVLDRTIFAGLAGGSDLAAEAFHAGTRATNAAHRILYDEATGRIFYDSDGSGGAAALLFARVDAGTALTSGDFLVAG